MASLVSTSFLVQAGFLVSSLWLVTCLQKHSLTDEPRLSSAIVLVLAGSFTVFASFVSRWIPGSAVKHAETTGIGGQVISLFAQNRKHATAIIFLIVIRLWIFQRVMDGIQCSGRGIEAFLPMLLAAHDFVIYQAPRAAPSDDPPEMWGSVKDDISLWFKESPVSLLGSSMTISLGVLLSMDLMLDSTYFCSTVVDSQRTVLFMQFAGVVADACIILMAKALLSRLPSTRGRLGALGVFLLSASMITALSLLIPQLSGQFEPADVGSYRANTIDYATDLVTTSFVAAIVLATLTLWTFEAGSALTPIGLATFLCGFPIAVQSTLYIGSFEQISPNQPLLVIGILFLGVTLFLHATTHRRAARARRFLIVVALFGVMLFCVSFSLLSRRPFGRHRVDELVYSKRVETDRWLRHASVSDSLRSAVVEYRERQHGREPPPGFDKWYQYAVERKAPVVDMYSQIEKDVLPFWGMEPRRIRDGLDRLKTLPDVGIVTIRQGIATHVATSAAGRQKEWLDDMVELIAPFAEHLPDMSLAFNLGRRPKILTPWEDIHALTEAGQQQRITPQPGQARQREKDNRALPGLLAGGTEIGNQGTAALPGATERYVSPATFRRLQALACPPGSLTRRGLDEGARDFCSSCAYPHSNGQFLSNWEAALDQCHQPDLFNLHEFYTLPHQEGLFQDLLPLFSTAKTDNFNDVLVPNPGDAKKTAQWNELANAQPDQFSKAVDLVSWQGDLGDVRLLTNKAHHGSHRNRLLHMLRNATRADTVAFLVGWKGYDGDDAPRYFHHEEVPTKNANGVLPFVVDLANKDGCTTELCQLLEAEFGSPSGDGKTRKQEEAHKDDTEDNHRYKIILDTQDGPLGSAQSTPQSPSFLRALYSPAKVPILSSIFREWHTERLIPWAHFIPLDIRYHALHSTVAYFVGLTGRGPLNGRMRSAGDMDAQTEDAKWIAVEGSRWARQALRREDMEVYMFRLLLEWGRVISDERNSLGFVMPVAG